ncbi:ENTH/VHS family protein [Perilla frutescens var. hirtella]|uniref:ENTH/VHS family protein n=1 Tax=Perilla frutescens var. hirtella TaxID=608512 RepID=A0AAD4P667_PERFH|nr:ENTH/VHS family protein [Perilla frutescens var. hirtella]
MSILGGNSSSSSDSMNGPIFHEFKKQASFFFKEKIKTARLALTDVTPAQLMVEEATNGNPEGPDARTLKMISKAAFEVDDYFRIVEILHKRLVRFERRNWRASYKALIVLEHLLTHGPERVAEEFEGDRDVITQMENFQHIDDKGFNWGLNVRKKSERILKLLVKGPLLKEERDKARKVSRGIQGFGSFCLRTSSDQESSLVKSFDRCNSDFTHHTNQEHLTKPETEPIITKMENSGTRVDSKENLAPREGIVLEREPYEGSRNCTGEKRALLGDRKCESRSKTSIEDHHPFADSKHQSAMSLLSGHAN